MFNVIDNPKFWRTVKVAVPADDGQEEATFRARFRVIDEDTAESFNLLDRDGVRDFMRQALVDLDEIVGEDGKLVPYSEDLREQMLHKTYVRVALLRTYSEAVTQLRPGN